MRSDWHRNCDRHRRYTRMNSSVKGLVRKRHLTECVLLRTERERSVWVHIQRAHTWIADGADIHYGERMILIILIIREQTCLDWNGECIPTLYAIIIIFCHRLMCRNG
ncbi:hypothetical protein D3C74_325260 [compost metagenome]